MELKSIEKLGKIQEVQLVNYLTATGINIGLLINFGNKGVKIMRKESKICIRRCRDKRISRNYKASGGL